MIMGWILISTVALMIGGIDIYAPTMPYLVHYFDVTPSWIQFTVTISPLVSSVFSFMWGAWADRYDHKQLMLKALMLFGVGALICAVSTCFNTFAFGRFIQAIGGSGLSIMTMILLYSVFKDPKDQARYMAIYGAMFPAVFALAPIIGAQLFEQCGWQSCFYIIVVISALFYGAYSYYVPSLVPEVKATQSPLKGVMHLLRTPYFMVLVLGHALPVSISMLFTVNSSFIFQKYFCFSPTMYALVQGIPISLNFIGAFYYKHLLKQKTIDETIRIGGLSVTIFCLGLLLFLLFPVLISAASIVFVYSIFTFFMSFSISSCATKAIDSRQEDRGLAVATIGTVRNFWGGFLVLLASQFYNATPEPMIFIMFCVAILLSFFMLYMIPNYQKG